jgi:branched-chain amino acid transport system permease protein
VSYLLLLLVHFEIYALVALSLNLLVGYTGLLHLAHVAYVGIGAYTYALVSAAGAGFGLSLLAAVGVASLASLLVSLPACRYRGHAFVMVSLAAQVGLFAVFYNWVGLTGGPFGLSGIAKPTVMGMSVSGYGSMALLYGLLTLAAYALIALAMRGAFGRNLKAIRDDELAARSIGISPILAKIQAFALASAMAGAAGAMYAAFSSYIDPTLYTVDEAILVLAMVLVGGSGNMVGPLVGAAVMVGLPEALRFLDVPTAMAANLRAGLFGLALVLIMRLRPQGLAGIYRFE